MRRGRLEIRLSLLDIILKEHIPTRVMASSCLCWRSLELHLKFLLKKGLIEQRKETHVVKLSVNMPRKLSNNPRTVTHVQYYLTEKGIDLLRKGKEVLNVLGEYDGQF